MTHTDYSEVSHFFSSILSLFSTKQEMNKKGSEIVPRFDLYHLVFARSQLHQCLALLCPLVITLRHVSHSDCQTEEVALISPALVSLRTADRFSPQPKRKRSFSNSAACETRPPAT